MPISDKQLAANHPDAKWSVSGLVKLQLRNQLQGERPRTIFACCLDQPPVIENHNGKHDRNKEARK